MIKLNIVNGGFIATPFNETLPFIEVTNEEFIQIQNGKLKLISGVLTNITDKNKMKDKLIDLENWFDNYFDKQLTQSMWQEDFTVSHDSYFDKDYANLDELKAQAKIVRDEIRELRKELLN